MRHSRHPYHLRMATETGARLGAASVDAGSANVLDFGTPLTVRVLARLGPPRWLWIVLWAGSALLTPCLAVLILAATGQSARVTSLPGLMIAQGALAVAAGLLLWGLGRLTDEAKRLEPDLAHLTRGSRQPGRLPASASVVVPVMLTLAVTAINAVSVAPSYGPLVPVLLLPLVFLFLLPLMTFAWTYLLLLLGLDRLGRARLALDLFPQDRSLGLGPVGSLAFGGFVLLLAAAVPILVTGSQSLSTVTLDLFVLGVVVLAFFLSMWRLHGQLREAKARYLAEMRALYAAAYAPLRAAPTLEALESQASTLGTAKALVERAENILSWPIDERLTATLISLVVGILISLAARVVLIAAGY